MNFTIALLLLVSPFGFADDRALTLKEYFDGQAKPGDQVCEPVLGTCYLEVPPPPALTKDNDPTGALAKGAITEKQGQFTRVEVAQILGELERGHIKATGVVDVYVKVNWEGVDGGPLGMSLGAKHLVHGRLRFEDDGGVKFEVTNVPDQMLLGTDNPSLDVAKIFGLNKPFDNTQIKIAHHMWLEQILVKVLPAALGLTPEVAPKP